MHIIARAGSFLLVLAALGLLNSCFSRDANDSALDALDNAVSVVESHLADFSAASLARALEPELKAIKSKLEKAGQQLQVAYAPVRDLAQDQLSMDQEKRAVALKYRAMSAAADLLDILL